MSETYEQGNVKPECKIQKLYIKRNVHSELVFQKQSTKNLAYIFRNIYGRAFVEKKIQFLLGEVAFGSWESVIPHSTLGEVTSGQKTNRPTSAEHECYSPDLAQITLSRARNLVIFKGCNFDPLENIPSEVMTV
jgi:hypothetical protein